ncbi:phosphonate ABC transporter, permease protein PhnE [Haloferax volcanii]|uniref:Phosphonate ABC transporter, permease protein PhnE n=4 Tax=Haloferacaceae TaxID=1644056 RepID=A0A8T5C0U8_HALVO|nr:phosphonate ABC transporter, permease protein PhnE [Haloferax volcanii]ADE02812.1 ABC-type transport system permease protein (probable substrate phosphate/phosphonate) [Haloferax volcanii DS2]ELY25717.1 putative phosphate/phosphonate ABC transporter permease [Haloferax volcanii DS2]MBS8118972.1 phosphonate ABC transporter, permease protein PhnE [Haloferax volcanii]MBS8123986.1 phosphonate ABC transporter, permease protein PhnE [Haloferax volcanii]MBS8127855.1 phosphonate ABC transporter, pe
MSTDTDRIEDALRNIQIAKRVRLLFSIVVLVLFAWFFTNALSEVGFSIGEIVEYWPEFTDALGDFFPPGTLFGVIPFVDVSQYWAFIQERNLLLQFQDGNPVLGAVFVTFAMGFVGTVLGIPGALILGVLGSERVTPYPFNFIFRGTMSVIRAIPALVWALIYIPLGGVSPFTATLAIGTDTMGNLGRLFTDALEEVEDGPIEAIESTGANSPQKVVFGMLSQVFTPFIAWTMYILEINVRIGVTMGLIGGGGLGQVLQTQRGLFRYTNMMATILVIFMLVVSVEFVSQRVRSYIRGNEEGTSLLKLIVEFPQRMARSIWE